MARVIGILHRRSLLATGVAGLGLVAAAPSHAIAAPLSGCPTSTPGAGNNRATLVSHSQIQPYRG